MTLLKLDRNGLLKDIAGIRSTISVGAACPGKWLTRKVGVTLCTTVMLLKPLTICDINGSLAFQGNSVFVF